MFKFILFFLLIVPVVNAQEMSVPRYASLKSEKVNLRAGPGERYPIEWIYQRIHLPIEIIDAYDNWYKLKDADNTTGWMRKNMISNRRFALTPKDKRLSLYKKDNMTSPVIAYFEGQSIVHLMKCDKGNPFCLVSYENLKGYILKNELFGLYPNEEVD